MAIHVWSSRASSSVAMMLMAGATTVELRETINIANVKPNNKTGVFQTSLPSDGRSFTWVSEEMVGVSRGELLLSCILQYLDTIARKRKDENEGFFLLIRVDTFLLKRAIQIKATKTFALVFCHASVTWICV